MPYLSGQLHLVIIKPETGTTSNQDRQAKIAPEKKRKSASSWLQGPSLELGGGDYHVSKEKTYTLR